MLLATSLFALSGGCHPPLGTVRTVLLGDGPEVMALVEATVRGLPVPLVFDTGAEWHVLTDSTAWGCGVETQGFEGEAWDGTGRSVYADLAQDPGALQVPGLPDNRLDGPAVVYSSAFRYTGFWGALSPQRLVRTGERLVVDFRAGRFTIVPEDEARWTTGGTGTATGTLETCRRPAAAAGTAARYFVAARVGGREARLLVDTGASQTLLYDDAPAGRELAARAEREDLLREIDRELGDAPAGNESSLTAPSFTVEVGGRTDLLEVRGVAVALGDWQRTTTVGVAARDAPGECAGEGVLGFDVLRFCELSLGPEAGAWHCSEAAPMAAEGEAPSEPVRLVAVDAAAACGRTADELRPEVTGGELPMTYPSLLTSFAVLYEDVEAHARRIEADCEAAGWVTARVRRPPLVRAEDELRVWFEVDEGPRYRVGAVTNRIVDANDAELRRVGLDELPWWRQRPGVWYSESEWTRDLFELLDALEPTIGPVRHYRYELVPDEAAGTVELAIDVVVEEPEPGSDERSE